MPTWIRCRDDITGAHFDVDPRSIRPGISPIPGYPVLAGPGARPRPGKSLTSKDGRPALRKPARTAEPGNIDKEI